MSAFTVDGRFAVFNRTSIDDAFRDGNTAYRGANSIVVNFADTPLIPLVPLGPDIEDQRPGGFWPEEQIGVPFSEEIALRRLEGQRIALRRRVLSQIEPDAEAAEDAETAPETRSGLTADEQRRLQAAQITQDAQKAKLELAKVQLEIVKLEARVRKLRREAAQRVRERDDMLMILLLGQ